MALRHDDRCNFRLENHPILHHIYNTYEEESKRKVIQVLLYITIDDNFWMFKYVV
jgi:hypothetical protein